MLAAVVCSCLFLISYLIYHANVGSIPYPHHDWTRPIYFAILIPHVILAVNEADPKRLLRALEGEAARRYWAIANGSQRKFLYGWLSRAYS